MADNPGMVRTDPWLVTVCTARVMLYANFMVFSACLPLVRQAWDLGYAEAGSVASGFILGYAVSLLLFSWAADHWGAKRMTVVSAAASAVSALAFGVFADSYLTALVLYTVAGLTQGGVYTPLIMLFAERYAPARRGTAVGWLIASTSAGYAGSLGLAALGVAMGGYRWAFLLTGAVPLIGAVLLIRALRDTENRVHARGSRGGAIGELVRNRPARLLVTGYVGHSWELLGMWAWMPAFLSVVIAGGGAVGAGAAGLGATFSAVMHLSGVVAASSMGGLSDRWGRRQVLILLAVLGVVFSATMGWTLAWPVWLVIGLALAYAFVALGDSPVLSTAITEVTDPSRLGGVLALRALLGFGAGAISPLVFGWMLDAIGGDDTGTAAWGWSFVMLGAGGVVAVWCAVRLVMPRHDAGS